MRRGIYLSVGIVAAALLIGLANRGKAYLWSVIFFAVGFGLPECVQRVPSRVTSL